MGMTPTIIARQRVAEFDAPVSGVEFNAAVRRVVTVGRGAILGLDRVHGIAKVEVEEYGGAAGSMAPGTAVARVWGGDPQDVIDVVEANRAAGTIVVAVCYPARWWNRLGAWCRWTWWRIWRDPR